VQNLYFSEVSVVAVFRRGGNIDMDNSYVDPTVDTTFVWKVRTTNPHNYTVSPMIYTNWHSRQPNGGTGEACMCLHSRPNQWYDERCTERYCAVCEVDM